MGALQSGADSGMADFYVSGVRWGEVFVDMGVSSRDLQCQLLLHHRLIEALSPSQSGRLKPQAPCRSLWQIPLQFPRGRPGSPDEAACSSHFARTRSLECLTADLLEARKQTWPSLVCSQSSMQQRRFWLLWPVVQRQ